jgi:hypothetical protein
VLSAVAQGSPSAQGVEAAEEPDRLAVAVTPSDLPRLVKVEVTVFLDDDERTLAAGGFAWAQRGLRHTFRLGTPDARLLLLITPGPAHEAMFREMGEAAAARSIPPPPSALPDAAKLAMVAARHGTQIVGPPPGGATR